MTRLVSALAAGALLAACTIGPGPTPLPTGLLAPVATAPVDRPPGAGGAVASAIVVAGGRARLAFPLSGQVEAVLVERGDRVAAGQVLVHLAGSARLTAAVEAADLERLAAQLALDDLRAGAGRATAQAELAVAQAREALDRAQTALGHFASPDLSYYQDQVDRAGDRLMAAQQNAAITNFEVALRAAQDALDAAAGTLGEYQRLEALYPGYSNLHNNVLEDAQKAYDRALVAFQTAQFRLQQAQATDDSALADAQKAYDTAVANQNAVRDGPDPVRLAIAQGEVAVAEAALAEAEVQAARVADGPDPDQLALAEARLANAEAQQAAGQDALDALALEAPFAATVTELSVTVGEWVSTGQPVLVLSDLDHLRVETTDLSERDVPALALGQRATVWIEALNLELPARVREIAPTAETLGGDVVYRTTLDLDDWPATLRPGMSAEVRFQPPP